MSLPLHDQERLGNHSKRGAFDHLPLGTSQRPATHQGLFLSADEDVLVGRAENGEQSGLILRLHACHAMHCKQAISMPTHSMSCIVNCALLILTSCHEPASARHMVCAAQPASVQPTAQLQTCQSTVPELDQDLHMQAWCGCGT